MPTVIYNGAKVPGEFLEVDDSDVTRRRITAEADLPDLTPLAGLEVYQMLFAARNKLRRDMGLPEIAMPDMAVVLFAFLRRFNGDLALEAMPEGFAQVVQEIQERRVEHATPREER